ncbi:MAG TPA: glutamate formimidoyltransferase [Chloroflexi bacterium]|nr:glutamate formimidoyltransferase [Chloroflexota bacterium]
MPNPLVECIPNFSEARRPEVVEEIIGVIAGVNGVHVLDRHSDLDHNRTVVTFVGTPQAVEEAAFLSIKKAAELINLDEHTGEHPRLGAADVVPFVPISDITMQDCVEMARRLGRRVGEELGLPVYLYEEAATRPERQNLENIRRGQYEALKEELGKNPERDPDFGPTRITPAGGVVIGARQPLIAFNVYLTTNDVSIAQKIARAVRNSSGGLRYVKAMGVLVEGRAQVSMNLTNFKQTPIFRVVEMIRREAERYGVGIHHSELVGLTPQAALINSALWYLQLDDFDPNQILEQRLYGVMSGTAGAEQGEPATDFLDALAAGTAAPGGGSAAAYTSAQAAALVAMVARLTVNKKKYEQVRDKMWALIDQAEALRRDLYQAVARDAAAFEEVMTAFKLPKNTEEEQQARHQAVQAATLHAANVPLEVARMSLQVMELALQAASEGNLNAITDAASAVTLARSGLTCAIFNVHTNILSLDDQAEAARLREEVVRLEQQADELAARIRTLLVERGGLQLA